MYYCQLYYEFYFKHIESGCSATTITTITEQYRKFIYVNIQVRMKCDIINYIGSDRVQFNSFICVCSSSSSKVEAIIETIGNVIGRRAEIERHNLRDGGIHFDIAP